MDYIKKNMMRSDLVQACAKGDLNAPSRLLTESLRYEEMMNDQEFLEQAKEKQATIATLRTYKEYLQNKIQQENSQSLDYLQKLPDEELYRIAYVTQSMDLSIYPETSIIHQNAKLIQTLYKSKTFFLPKEQLEQYHSNVTMASWLSIQEFLKQDPLSKALSSSVSYNREEL
ncbi:MAG: hypothetical protein GXP45_05665 [bacterium]|nr:hypothetical protein [bacterium]